jgi:orotidine-5'-phosphate decarboxylase
MPLIGGPFLPDTFSRKLENAFSSKGHLCVGIDPHEALIDESGFTVDSQGLERFSMKLLDEVTDVVSIVKPQVSFFERFGAVGFAVLERLLSEASQRGLLVIADAKRGDIGSTMQAYTDAWLSKNAPFICDGLTLSPYLGIGSLHGAIAAATERGKAVFVLCATSNPEGREIQTAAKGDSSVAEMIAKQVIELNQVSAASGSRFGNVGLVVGATVDDPHLFQTLKVQKEKLRSPILAPGFGAQGAELSEIHRIFGSLTPDVICSVSRDILTDGIDNAKRRASAAQESINEALAG